MDLTLITNCLLFRAVGPGHVSLVMNDVLSKLVNVGYKPAKVLKELQVEIDDNDDGDMEKQVGALWGKFRPLLDINNSLSYK